MTEGQPLTGGNMNAVVRHGDLVHREAGPWTATVHRLLDHLAAAGIEWAPTPHGSDGHGREVVTYLHGEVPLDPMPAWTWDDDVLSDAARHLAQLHDATTGYRDDDAVWQLPVHEPQEVVCHNDFAPYNMVFDPSHRLVGVIDWDTASPGPRAWDLAYLAYRLVPLSAPGNPDSIDTSVDEHRRRLALLCDAYGAGVTPGDVVAAAVERMRELADFTARRAAEGAAHVADHVALYVDAADWICEQASALLRRVQDGETIEVTDRERPVAILAPVPDVGRLAELRATGQTEGGGGDLTDLPEPLVISGDGPTPSEILAAMRRDER